MLPPGLLPGLLLLLLAGNYLAFIRGDLGRYPLLRRLGEGDSRRGRYRVLAAKDVIGFAAPALLALALLGRLDAVGRLPEEFEGLQRAIGPIGLLDRHFVLGMTIGGGGGTILGVGLSLWRMRRGKRPPMLGDVGALLPRDRGELGHAALLSITAGVTEELFFRLALPLLLALVLGDALVAFVVATLLFGVAHRYQGWIGVVATSVVGALFSALYLATGSLWAAMVFHALIDLNGLVLRPAMTGAWRR